MPAILRAALEQNSTGIGEERRRPDSCNGQWTQGIGTLLARAGRHAQTCHLIDHLVQIWVFFQ